MNVRLSEPLEPRRLLAGVTLITHGYERSSGTPAWVTTMGNLVRSRLPGSDLYRVTVANGSGGPVVSAVKQLAGSASRPAGDAVILLDWSGVSSRIFSDADNADEVAKAVVPVLTAASAVRSTPFAELPIHLMGHSRGASLVTALAKRLGLAGINVDQVTTFDPRPVPPDPDAVIWSNIAFADNYYQTTTFLIAGSSISGAHNVKLDSVLPDPDLAYTNHSRPYAYYAGIVSPTATSIAGLGIKPAYYTTPKTGPRDSVGYAWSRVGGDARPTDGLKSAGASRRTVTVTTSGAARWDNVALDAPASAVVAGSPLTISAAIDDANADATVTWFFDTDTNPYDGVITPAPPTAGTLDTAALPAGSYYLGVSIDNGTHRRFEYAVAPLTVLPAGSTPPPAGGRVVTFSAAAPLAYTDATGQRVTARLTGPGMGMVTFVSPGNADPTDVVLTGTTARSGIAFTGATRIGHVAAGAMSTLTLPTVTGGISLSGAVGRLTLAGLSGNSTVTSVATLSLGAVTDATLTATGRLTSVRATAWLDPTGPADVLSAARIDRLTIDGDLQADVTATTLGTLLVGGAITGASISATAGVGRVSAASSAGLTVSAGPSLGALVVPGVFADGVITATQLGSASLGTLAGHSTVTLTRLGTLSADAPDRLRLRRNDASPSPLLTLVRG